MSEIQNDFRDLAIRLAALKKKINWKEKNSQLKDLKKRIAGRGFWQKRQEATKVATKIAQLEKVITPLKELEERLKMTKDLFALARKQPDESLSKELGKEVKDLSGMMVDLEQKAFLSGRHDDKDALVSIHAGQGGTEAMDWTAMLQRMYSRYSQRRHWQADVIEMVGGDEAGVKSVTLRIRGNQAYGYLKNENGIHLENK